jgi:ABC-type multidrug transport system ATPase subunit
MSSVIRVTGLTKHFSASWNRWKQFVRRTDRTEPAKVPTEEELSKYPRNEGYERGRANTWSSSEVLPTKADMRELGYFSDQTNYRTLKAVDELSFSVEQADIYGFLGQNGAGKSTTIRMLLTLIAPTSGRIELFGMDLQTHRREILRRVGAVIERPDLYKYLTAYENLSLFARISGIRPSSRILMQQLEQVGLAERAHSKVKTFSQGMKQRLGIAVALVHNPDLVILDEPTNGLDPQGIADIRNLILHLSAHEKKTLLVSSHLLSEMELIANRMLIIDRGRKIVEGKASDLFDPGETLVELDTPEGVLAEEVLRQSSWGENLQSREGGKLLLKIDKTRIPSFVRDLVEQGVPVAGIQPRHSLEDYFLSLTTANQHVEAFRDRAV